MIRVIDEKVLVYGDIDATALPIFVLAAGDEVLLDEMVRARDRVWLKIRDDWDTAGFIDAQVGMETIAATPERDNRQRWHEGVWWLGMEPTIGYYSDNFYVNDSPIIRLIDARHKEQENELHNSYCLDDPGRYC